MKIRTIMGVLLVLALMLGSTGVAAAKIQLHDDWVEATLPDGTLVLVPPKWVLDGELDPTADNPNDVVPKNWDWIYP